MTIRVALNGAGRIGRLILRLLAHRTDIRVVAVNDLIAIDHLAYLIRFDSTQGTASVPISVENSQLTIGSQSIVVSSEKDPEKLPWKELEIDYVIEATGHFTDSKLASMHRSAGAKRVILTAPGTGEFHTLVLGVNESTYDPQQHYFVSNASCTTNCLAPLAKVVHEAFGIEEGLMTTIHAVTATQPPVDGPSKKDWRGGRGAMQNIIPASTGAAKAVTQCLPELKGKLTGMAFRVPIPTVSVVDLTVRLKTSTNYQIICQQIQAAAQGPMQGILQYCEEEVVSSDFIGSLYSSIFDAKAGVMLNDRFYKLIAWYDNEMGYAARVVDLIAWMAQKE